MLNALLVWQDYHGWAGKCLSCNKQIYSVDEYRFCPVCGIVFDKYIFRHESSKKKFRNEIKHLLWERRDKHATYQIQRRSTMFPEIPVEWENVFCGQYYSRETALQAFRFEIEDRYAEEIRLLYNGKVIKEAKSKDQ
jgi:predicted RNA-binding Zn-ribbon protein involved in translation (DUF1610 family)